MSSLLRNVGNLPLCFINHFFYEACFLFLVLFVYINSIYIKLDTPYFHKVQIKISIHCWLSSCCCLNNSNIFHSMQVSVLLSSNAATSPSQGSAFCVGEFEHIQNPRTLWLSACSVPGSVLGAPCISSHSIYSLQQLCGVAAVCPLYRW